MTIILPQDPSTQRVLVDNQVISITEEKALTEDIRPLRIGILNIMPKAANYEFNLLHPLGRSVMQIVPIWIRLQSHQYSSSDPSYIKQSYISYQEALEQGHLDGLIVTGAPVGLLTFEQVHYWEEIKGILEDSRQNSYNTLGICWGALALAKVLGVNKMVYPKKLFGVFETYNLNEEHRITGGLDDVFWLPQSRHSGIANKELERAKDEGLVNLLAFSEEAGYAIFESFDHKYLMNTGHLEYNAHRIVEEALRDKGRDNVPPPENFDVKTPLNRWRGQRNEFFSQWVKYLHDERNRMDPPKQK